jgi:ADP-dependent phosphofructokinase/glucokinase
MVHQGKELQKLINNDKRETEAIAKKMGYTRMNLNRLTKKSKLSANQLAKIGKVYDIAIITGTAPVKASAKSTDFGSNVIKKLEGEIDDLKHTNEDIKVDLRELNKKFNALVMGLATGKKAKV